MIRRPPRSTRTDTLFPYTTLFRSVMADSITPILDAGLALFVDSNHVIVDEVRLESTPGHTPGHCAVVVSSEGQEAVITGDLIHHPVKVAIPHVGDTLCWKHDMAR